MGSDIVLVVLVVLGVVVSVVLLRQYADSLLSWIYPRRADKPEYLSGDELVDIELGSEEREEPAETGAVADTSQAAGDEVDDAGVREAAADDEDGGDRGDGRMAEAEEGLVGRYDAADDDSQEGQEGDHVITPFAGDKQNEGGDDRDIDRMGTRDIVQSHIERRGIQVAPGRAAFRLECG